jgi:hypothetical protein
MLAKALLRNPARTVCLVLVGAYVLAYVALQTVFDANRFGLDLQAYWLAADRLSHGAQLYDTTGLTGYQEYRYAPWLAAIFWMFGGLPRSLVDAAWVSVALVTIAWLAWPMRRSLTGIILAGLIVPQMIEYAWLGNIDAYVLAAIALYGSRFGPVLVGIAASLKIAPIGFVLVYAWRREWRRMAVAIVTALVLWAPALAFDLSLWQLTFTPSSPFAYSPVLGIAWITAALLAATAVFRRSPVLAGALVAITLTPRIHLYTAGILVIPAREVAT